jgi:hypothetical protein
MKGFTMKRVITAATWGIILSCLSEAGAGTLFTNPVIVVSPHTIDFGSVPWKGAVTNTFLVENWGGGKLVGKATVSRPFKILSGGSYRLGRADVQVVTISYTPSGAPGDTNVVKFTGGAGASATVLGRLAGPPPDLSRGK